MAAAAAVRAHAHTHAHTRADTSVAPLGCQHPRRTRRQGHRTAATNTGGGELGRAGGGFGLVGPGHRLRPPLQHRQPGAGAARGPGREVCGGGGGRGGAAVGGVRRVHQQGRQRVGDGGAAAGDVGHGHGPRRRPPLPAMHTTVSATAVRVYHVL